MNATIDVAKIVLASSGRPVPRTYFEAVAALALISGFDRELVEQLSSHIRLRNFLAHEYLDIRYSKIRALLDDEPELHRRFIEIVRGWTNETSA